MTTNKILCGTLLYMKRNHGTTAFIYSSSFILLLAISYVMYQSNDSSKQKKTTSQKMSFFITSKNPGNGGDLGGLQGADNYCTTLAENVGVRGKTWKAYLSTVDTATSKGINARDRIGDGPWRNAKGELVASTVQELHMVNNISKSSALNEYGVIVLGRGDTPNEHDILTGSTEDGVALATSTDTTCSNWTSSLEGSALVGHHDRIGKDDTMPMKSWNSSHLTRGCSVESLKTTGGAGLFYCFAE